MPIYSAALNIAAIQYGTAIDYAGTYQKVMVEFDFLYYGLPKCQLPSTPRHMALRA